MSEEIRFVVPEAYLSIPFHLITYKTTFQNCVLKSLEKRGWKRAENNAWNLTWTEKQKINEVYEEGVGINQRVNHFRLYTQVSVVKTRKDMLIKNIRKHKKLLQKHQRQYYDEKKWCFFPMTFFLPSEYFMFVEEFKKSGGLWIMKPTARCQGSGIFIVDKINQVAPYRHKTTNLQNATPNKKPKIDQKQKEKQVQYEKEDALKKSDEEKEQDSEQEQQSLSNPNETYIIQRYIENPLLFGKKKFDIRIYVLCTNYSALTAWLYRSGFARFTHQPYDNEEIDNLESHLTNVGIQKNSKNYDEVRGGKWLLDRFKHYLFSIYSKSKVDQCFASIKDAIIKSLESVQKSIVPSKSSFQLYGYDFMIDSDLNPWLIQVNGGPSMTANTDFDCRLKCGVIDDTLSIIDLQGFRSGKQMSVGGFDLIVDRNLHVKMPPQSEYTSLLGSRNMRNRVLRQIAKKNIINHLKQEIVIEKPQRAIQRKKIKVPSFENRKAYIRQDISQLKYRMQYYMQQNFMPLNACE